MSRVLLEVTSLARGVIELRVEEGSLVLPILPALCVNVRLVIERLIGWTRYLACNAIEVICISSELVVLFARGVGLLAIEVRSVLLKGISRLTVRHILAVELRSACHGVALEHVGGRTHLAIVTEELLGIGSEDGPCF